MLGSVISKIDNKYPIYFFSAAFYSEFQELHFLLLSAQGLPFRRRNEKFHAFSTCMHKQSNQSCENEQRNEIFCSPERT